MKNPVTVRVKVGILIAVIAVATIVGAYYYYYTYMMPPSPGVIKIGSVWPLTGPHADIAWHDRNGIELAATQINEEGGLLVGGRRYKIEVIFGDDEAKIEISTAVVTRLIEHDKIDFAVGHQLSSLFLSAMDIYQRYGIPVIDCCAATPGIFQKIAENRMKYVFQLSPTSLDIGTAMVACAWEYFRPKTYAQLNDDTDAGRTIAAVTRGWFEKNHPEVKLLADECTVLGATDFYDVLTKFKHLGAEVLIGETPGIGGAAMLSQYYELQVPIAMVQGGATWNTEEFINEHKKELEGTVMNNRWWPGPHTSKTLPMIEAYRKKYGKDPSNFAVQAYDGMLVLFEALKKAGTLDKDKVVEALETIEVEAVWGWKKFTSLEEGHRCPVETVMVQIQNGKKIPIWPLQLVDPSIGKFKPVPPWPWEIPG